MLLHLLLLIIATGIISILIGAILWTLKLGASLPIDSARLFPWPKLRN